MLNFFEDFNHFMDNVNPIVKEATSDSIHYNFLFPGHTTDDIEVTLAENKLSVVSRKKELLNKFNMPYKYNYYVHPNYEVKDVVLEYGILRITFALKESNRPRVIPVKAVGSAVSSAPSVLLTEVANNVDVNNVVNFNNVDNMNNTSTVSNVA